MVKLRRFLDIIDLVLLVALSLVNVFTGILNNANNYYLGVFFQGHGIWTMTYYADTIFAFELLLGYGTFRIYHIINGLDSTRISD